MTYGEVFCIQTLIIPIILLLAVGGPFIIKRQLAKIYAVCRDEMLAIEGYGPWIYQRTSLFPSPIAVIFDDGTNIAECQVQWNGSKWQVINIWRTLVGRFEQEGKFGIIP